MITPHSAFHTPEAWDDIRRKSAETMAAALLTQHAAERHHARYVLSAMIAPIPFQPDDSARRRSIIWLAARLIRTR